MSARQLDEFFDYKNKLMEDLLTNSNIVKLIDEEIDIKDAHMLAYNRVFPVEFVPETIEEGDTFVCFDVDILEVVNKTFLNPALYVWVFTHKSKLRLPEGGVRVDELCSEIAEAINGSFEYGLGELNLHSVRRYPTMTDFYGRAMTFLCRDYNRQHGQKNIPPNRKRG